MTSLVAGVILGLIGRSLRKKRITGKVFIFYVLQEVSGVTAGWG
jgi:hypothetical protein